MALVETEEEDDKAEALGRGVMDTAMGVKTDTGSEEAMALAMAAVAQEAQEGLAVAVGQVAMAG